jgi:hypothetical protein
MIYFVYMKLEERAIEQLRDHAEDFGWSLAAESQLGLNLELRTDRGTWSVELKCRPVARAEQLTAALAAAALQARRHAAPPSQPMALVFVPRLSANMLEHLERYAREYLEGTAWGAFDARGVMRCPALGIEQSARDDRVASPLRRQSAPPLSGASTNPFSDLGQWLLKVAYASQVPDDLLAAPRGQIRNQAQFAQLAQVSPATVTRWLHGFEGLGLLQADARSLQPGPIRRVLRDWARAAYTRSPRELAVVARLGSVHKSLAKLLHEYSDAALCRYSACEALGVSIVSGAIPSVYLADWDASTLDSAGLRPALAGEQPELVLVEPRFPESVRRGAVQTSQGRCTDIIQCYLDLVDHPTRGREQADAILAKLKSFVSW